MESWASCIADARLGVQSVRRHIVNTVASMVNSLISVWDVFLTSASGTFQEMFFYTWNPWKNFHTAVLSVECCFVRTLWAPWSGRLVWPRHRIMMIRANEGLLCCHSTSAFTQRGSGGAEGVATFSDPWMDPRLWGCSQSWAENNLFAWQIQL